MDNLQKSGLQFVTIVITPKEIKKTNLTLPKLDLKTHGGEK
jgi:hypothetical protein